MFEFLWPWLGVCLPLPLLVRRFLPAARAEDAALKVPFFANIPTPSRDPGHLPRSRRRVLVWLVWLALVAATARPVWLGEELEVPISGRDLLLAIDLSGSMDERDFVLDGRAIRRLDALKAVARPFIERRDGDRIGLILFGEQAYVQTPLTFDRATVGAMLMESEIGFAGRKTAIGDAIGLAVKRMRVTKNKGPKVLVLLSDGANTAGEVSPAKAAELAADTGLKIHTIGMGADRGTTTTIFGSRLWNPSSDLDERSLKAIAEITGGRYFRAKDTSALEQVYRTLDELEPAVKDMRLYRPRTALFMWPLGLALLISMLMAVRHLIPGAALSKRLSVRKWT